MNVIIPPQVLFGDPRLRPAPRAAGRPFFFEGVAPQGSNLRRLDYRRAESSTHPAADGIDHETLVPGNIFSFHSLSLVSIL